MLGAYAAFWAFSLFGLSPLVAAPLVAATGGALGYALYRGVFRRLLAGATPATAGRLEGNSLLLFFGLSIRNPLKGVLIGLAIGTVLAIVTWIIDRRRTR